MIDAARFWTKVEKTGECWVWKGARQPTGYGTLRSGGRYFSAHRASFELHFGQIPSGKIILHKCDNPSCVRPDHLKLGTHRENSLDARSKGRIKSTKLTPEKVQKIRTLLAIGRSKNSLSKEFGVDRVVIRKIQNGETWMAFDPLRP